MIQTAQKGIGLSLKRRCNRMCTKVGKKNNVRKIINFLCCFVITIFLTQNVAVAEDGENCLLCHKMPNFGIYEGDQKKNQEKRLFFIDSSNYKYSYHGRVKCVGCHNDIDQIPHGDVNKVDCASECHIRDPSSNGWYSHKHIAQDLQTSIHGVKEKDSADYPVCKYCHTNKPYQNDNDGLGDIDKFINVCLQCHESAEWTERFFKHINYRARIRRSSKQIVALCSQCHADGSIMGRHGLDVVVGFNDTFHGKAIKYGNTEVANCLNCHAPYKQGYSPHSIISQDNDKAPVSQLNKLDTCRQSGCHVNAKKAFAAQGKVHPSSYGLVSWMRPRSDVATTDMDEDFQKQVIYLINLFYKFLIIVVVGGLAVHQLINLRAIKRDAQKEMR